MDGLVIGKFCPLHLGHSYLIDQALSQGDRLHVILCSSSRHPIAGEIRLEWLAQAYPQVERYLLDIDAFDNQNEQAWVRAIQELMPHMPKRYFTSESYGERYAALLGTNHIMVDEERKTVPISARTILADPQRWHEFIHPVARSYFDNNDGRCIRR